MSLREHIQCKAALWYAQLRADRASTPEATPAEAWLALRALRIAQGDYIATAPSKPKDWLRGSLMSSTATTSYRGRFMETMKPTAPPDDDDDDE